MLLLGIKSLLRGQLIQDPYWKIEFVVRRINVHVARALSVSFLQEGCAHLRTWVHDEIEGQVEKLVSQQISVYLIGTTHASFCSIYFLSGLQETSSLANRFRTVVLARAGQVLSREGLTRPDTVFVKSVYLNCLALRCLYPKGVFFHLCESP